MEPGPAGGTIEGKEVSMSRMRVVIAGAGVAALEAALALRDLAPDVVSVELVAPEPDFVYRPLAVAEPFRMGEVRRFPLEALVSSAGATLRHGTVVAVDSQRKTVALEDGAERGYDVLLAALGARPQEAVAGALTFAGPESMPEIAALLERLTTGGVRRLAFAVPSAAAWPLPIYELSLLASEFLVEAGTRGVEILLVTPEDRPLALFGPEASDAVAELLALREIEVVTGVVARAWEDGVLRTVDESIEVDAVVALPQLVGPSLSGLPHDARGFVPTDEFGWVLGSTDVYAAGDMTQFAVKQGGLATQQADAAASAIAADAGAVVHPTPFKPVLRGVLLTGFVPRYLRAEPGRGISEIDTQPLWWPPAKIVGRYLAPFLASQLGLSEGLGDGGLEVEVELDRQGRSASTRV
jgi:sulfide:quinone oxidoreductase